MMNAILLCNVILILILILILIIIIIIIIIITIIIITIAIWTEKLTFHGHSKSPIRGTAQHTFPFKSL